MSVSISGRSPRQAVSMKIPYTAGCIARETRQSSTWSLYWVHSGMNWCRPAWRALPVERKTAMTIKKVKSGYRLINKAGRNLGTAKSKAGAKKREREVQYFKHRKKS